MKVKDYNLVFKDSKVYIPITISYIDGLDIDAINYRLKLVIRCNSYDIVKVETIEEENKKQINYTVLSTNTIENDGFHKDVGLILVAPPIWALKNYVSGGKLQEYVFVVEDMSFGSLRPLVYVADATEHLVGDISKTNSSEGMVQVKSPFLAKLIETTAKIRSTTVSDVVPYIPDKINRVRIKKFWASFSRALYDTFEVSITIPYQPNAIFTEGYSIMQPKFYIIVYDKITQNRLGFFSRPYYLKAISHSLSSDGATTTLTLLGLPPI